MGLGTAGIGGVKRIWWISLWLLTIYFTYLYSSGYPKEGKMGTSFINRDIMMVKNSQEYQYNSVDQKPTLVKNDQDMPLIFIGGMPRSGTTLMRTMLDAHPDVRCGQETRVIPRLLFMRNNWIRSVKERRRLEEAGILPKVLDQAVSQFILEIIINHGSAAKFLCNKDPFTLKATTYLHELFPNAKFILMLRDGRATAHSIISRKVTIAGFDITSYRDVLTKWNRALEVIHNQCNEVGSKYCLSVHYETLVLRPVQETKRIFTFLDIPWSDHVLHHEKYLPDIQLSKLEKSTDQVQRPLYLDALTSWFGHIPEDVERDMAKIAPMLTKLGYDPSIQRPSYGEPDEFIKSQMSSRNSTQQSS
uniref:Protein-tyrosine sulfotransferase n=1 Tax=Halocynthia roretzi TaxID=7729 RepID=Q86R90_HALRO|nr:tyrosylprotein sulfotransferase-2 [Halocynthia roretzi]